MFSLLVDAAIAADAEPAGATPVHSNAPALAQPIDRPGAVRLFDSWKAPVPPRRLLANIHYVGAIGVSSYLITTPEGHFLLDTGFEETVPIIQRSVEQLGFRLSDIRFILSSHAHIDHTGGHAAMKRLVPGAIIVASKADARVLASGGADDFIPFPKDLIVYTPVVAKRIVNDGEKVTLGGVTLTANLTPGHTRGATTWTMEVNDDGRTLQVVFFSSASLNAGTRLLGQPAYPEIVQDFENTFTRLRSLPCDVFFAPHGGQFAMAEKFARHDRGEKDAFIDPEGWRVLIANAEKAYRDQLRAEQEAAGTK
jgi:metallo-beta-lactamase class B